MAYIGRPPEYGGYERQVLTADGSTTSFALDFSVGSESSLLVSVAGVVQQPGTAYTLSGGGSSVVFSVAPANGATVFVIFLGFTYDAGTLLSTGAITSQTNLGTSPSAADVFLMYDDSASAFKKVAYSDLESDTANMAANTVKVRDADSTGVPSNKVVTNTQILIGDGTGFTAAALSGDVTMTNAGAVTIAAGSIDLAHMSVNSIDSDQYVDASIDLAHMSVNSIDSDQYVDASIDLAHMSVNSIDSDQYVDGSIDNVHVAAGLDAVKLADGTVTNAELQFINTVSSNVQTQLGTKAVLTAVQTYTAGQRGQITALSSGSTITIDMADSNNFSVTLAHSPVTFANPSNDTAGQSGSIFITQDGTGSRTASWASDWDFAGGSAPTLTTTAAAVDRIDYVILDSTNIHAVATLNYS